MIKMLFRITVRCMILVNYVIKWMTYLVVTWSKQLLLVVYAHENVIETDTKATKEEPIKILELWYR